ncbi:MAG: hypothetical protein KIT57_18725 [Blastocatellales bacterium]|nr:hypothetical protein [Blastocatellales bacterium]
MIISKSNLIDDPGTEYRLRLNARRESLERTEALSRRLWMWRRIVFAAGVALLLAFFQGWTPFWWVALPIVAFIALMAVHERIHRRRDHFARAAAYYERGLARLDDDWAGTGETGERFAVPHHPFSEDLDLFGRGSLFELLSTARTRAGEEKLAAWLLNPAPPAEIRARQAAVAELRPRLDLREDLALLAADVRTGVDGETLRTWGAAPEVHFSKALRISAALISIAAPIAVAAWLMFDARAAALLLLLVEGMFFLRVRAQTAQVIASVDRPSRDLKLFAETLERIERETFTSPRLVELRAVLDTGGHPPSYQIRRLSRLIEILDSTRNILFAPIAALLLIPIHLVFAIERWRSVSGRAVGEWLEAVGEFEALSSLAGYSAEHPEDPFPEIAEDEPSFIGAGLAHPLLPAARAVRNDVELSARQRALIISGSNMSGKSTMLRTVGINAVLAQAGATVRARALKLSPLSIGASIHILDSLQEGSSRFYAEITRLRQIVDLARGERTLLFLLDEILSGTNSHDRRTGASSVVKGLVERGAIGLVTTHDLALTEIANELGERAANVHFEDHLEDGRMTFDYRMRTGVVRKSNAIELMRAVGLEV